MNNRQEKIESYATWNNPFISGDVAYRRVISKHNNNDNHDEDEEVRGINNPMHSGLDISDQIPNENQISNNDGRIILPCINPKPRTPKHNEFIRPTCSHMYTVVNSFKDIQTSPKLHKTYSSIVNTLCKADQSKITLIFKDMSWIYMTHLTKILTAEMSKMTTKLYVPFGGTFIGKVDSLNGYTYFIFKNSSYVPDDVLGSTRFHRSEGSIYNDSGCHDYMNVTSLKSLLYYMIVETKHLKITNKKMIGDDVVMSIPIGTVTVSKGAYTDFNQGDVIGECGVHDPIHLMANMKLKADKYAPNILGKFY